MAEPNPYEPMTETTAFKETHAVTNRFRVVATLVTLTAVLVFIGVAIAASQRAATGLRTLPTPYYLFDDEESVTPN